MKTLFTHNNLRRDLKLLPRKIKFILAVFILITGLYACVPYGYDGMPGDSYLAVTWYRTQPDYLDVGTSDIPPVFEWGAFYRAWPGYYTMYYEGSYWNGYRYARYAWEMNYEIYRIAGEPGGPNYNGADGPNTYFTLECSPFGPEIYTDTRYYKKGNDQIEKPEKEMLTGQTDSVVVVKNDLKLKLVYKKVEPRTEQKRTNDLSTGN